MRVAEFATLLLGTKPSKKLMGLIEKDALKRDAIRTIISPRLTRFRSVRVAKARNTVRRARGIGRKAYELTKYEALPELLPPTRGLHREGRGLVFVVNADPSIVSGLDQWLRSWFDVHSFMSRDPRVQSLVNRGAIVLATDYELPDHVLMTDASEAPYTGAHIHRVKDLEHAKQIVWDAL